MKRTMLIEMSVSRKGTLAWFNVFEYVGNRVMPGFVVVDDVDEEMEIHPLVCRIDGLRETAKYGAGQWLVLNDWEWRKA